MPIQSPQEARIIGPHNQDANAHPAIRRLIEDVRGVAGLSREQVTALINAAIEKQPAQFALADSVYGELQFGLPKRIGVDEKVARADHSHGTPPMPTWLDVGADQAGSADKVSALFSQFGRALVGSEVSKDALTTLGLIGESLLDQQYQRFPRNPIVGKTYKPIQTPTILIGKFCSVSTGLYHSLFLKTDGTVVANGNNFLGQGNVSTWADIIAVSAGSSHSIGLKSDGTVVATGRNAKGQCNVSTWSDIIAISAGTDYSLGLKSDGTVVAVGDNADGQCNVSSWSNIIAISAGYWTSLGLKSDGTAVAVGNNESLQCEVSYFTSVVAVASGFKHSLLLLSDGTVQAVGMNTDGQLATGDWYGVIAIAAGLYHSTAVLYDGTVVSVGWNDEGQCDVGSMSDIIGVSGNYYHSIALMSDGSVVAIGKNEEDQCNVSGISSVAANCKVVDSNQYLVFDLKKNGIQESGGWIVSGESNIISELFWILLKMEEPYYIREKLNVQSKELYIYEVVSDEGEFGLFSIPDVFVLTGIKTHTFRMWPIPGPARKVIIKNRSSEQLTILPRDDNLIEGASSLVLDTGECVTLLVSGYDWIIIG